MTIPPPFMIETVIVLLTRMSMQIITGAVMMSFGWASEQRGEGGW